MYLRYLFLGGLLIIMLSPGRLFAATIEISDGSIIVGEILHHSEESFAIRMKNGAKVEIRSCHIVRIQTDAGEDSLKITTPKTSIRFAGSNTVGAQLIPEIAKAFVTANGAKDTHWISERDHERTLQIKDARGCVPKQIEVKAHGSSTAFVGLKEGATDIGMSSRSIKQKEISMLSGLGDLTGPQAEYVLALDGVAIIVHPENPLQMLTVEQIAAIFSGEITDWASVGAGAGSINVYARDDKSGTFDTFSTLVLKPRGRALIAAAKRFESNMELSAKVATDRQGIGFVGLAYIRNSKAITINECNLLYPPSTFAMKTEEYPLARRLFLYTAASSSSLLVKEFLDYALSDYGQTVAKETGFVDLSIASGRRQSATDLQLSRLGSAISSVQDIQVLKNFMNSTMGATRLSVTFRFRSASARLDNRGLQDVKRLAQYMKNGKGKGKQLLLFGFADTLGDYAQNLSLSKARAQSVAKQLEWSGARVTLVKGMGEESPVACNDNAIGRDKNRRVETWIK